MSGNTQALLGQAKIISKSVNNIEVKSTFFANSSSLLVCYSAADGGGECSVIAMDENFGLTGNVETRVQFCPVNVICTNLALCASTAELDSAGLCFSRDINGACAKIMRVASKLEITIRTTISNTEWNSISLQIGFPSTFMLCSDSSCCLLNQKTLALMGSTLDSKNTCLIFPSASIISAASLGAIAKDRHRLLVCYFGITDMTVSCSTIQSLSNLRMYRSSSSVLFSKSSNLYALTVLPIGLTSAMICYSGVDSSPLSVSCSTVTIDEQGVVFATGYEMIVDELGFYYQKITSSMDTNSGAYLAMSVSKGDIGATSIRLTDVVVLPDFNGTFQFAKMPSLNSSLVSVGCVAVNFDDVQPSRFCVGTSKPLQKPLPATPPLPPKIYCQVKPAICKTRSDYCILVGKQCRFKYDCSTKSPGACLRYRNAGALCKFDYFDNVCVPNYDWDSQSMCGMIIVPSQCTLAWKCVWANKQCRASPYCDWITRATCIVSLGCRWVGNMCGVVSL